MMDRPPPRRATPILIGLAADVALAVVAVGSPAAAQERVVNVYNWTD